MWGRGRGAELVNQPPYVGVEHRIKLAAKAQCHIRIPFYTVFYSVIFNSVIICFNFHSEALTVSSYARVSTFFIIIRPAGL